MFVDSHCHLSMLDLAPYNGDLSALVEKAQAEGVEHMLCVATELKNSEIVKKIAEQFDNISASIGLHPSETVNPEPSSEDLIALAGHAKVVAIGETGLDYYYNTEGLEQQRERFRTHIRAAKAVKKPLIIHTRSAREDTIRIMQEEQADTIGGVMHCFTESWEMAQQALALNFYISFSGIVTFKNAKEIVEVAERVPLDRILIETDSPYLAPVPFRGKKNEPQYVRFVAEKIAEIKKITIKEVAEQTTKNFYRLFFNLG